MKKTNKIAMTLTSGLAICGMAMGSNAIADPVSEQNKETEQHISSYKHKAKEGGRELGKGWKLSSTGGLSYVNPHDDRHWFKLSGVIRLDETIFMGSYRDKQSINSSNVGNFPSGGALRTIETYFDGGLGENWEYTITLNITGSTVSLQDTYLSYFGLIENNQIYVGRVPGNWFGLDNSNSTSWNPFLERSLPSIAFYPLDGLGAMTDFWWESGGLTLSAFQPDQSAHRLALQGDPNVTTSTPIYGARDRWTGVARATVAPVHEAGNVWHFGVSGAWRELISTYNGEPVSGANAIAYSTYPSARNRTVTSLVNTGPITANNVRLFNVEAARQYGAFMLEGEYTTAYVHRIGGNLGSVNFEGWNIQTRYLLTGEEHKYDVRDGNFGSVKPSSSHGAIELAARYDFLNLNDKDVRGGTEHNVTVGLNWFLNQQFRLSANYIRASIHPASDAPKRNLDIIGLRAQVKFN